MKPRPLWIASSLLIAAAAAAALAWPWGPRVPSAVRGKHVAEASGCFACHGAEGRGGVADPVAPGGEIPDWSYHTARLFIRSAADVRDWILHGSTPAERQRGAGRHRSIAPMPAYAGTLSRREVDDVVAYFLAVSGWRPSYTEQEFLGWQVAERLGCFGCHGPSGIGGVPDPLSRSGWVPPLRGFDARELRAGTLFGGRGGIGMPGYHDFLSDAELAQLIAYLQALQTEPRETEADTENEAAEVIGAASGPRRAPGLLGVPASLAMRGLPMG